MKSIHILGTISTGMTFCLLMIMVLYGIDSLFFNGEGQTYILMNYRLQMMGVIMLITWGGGGLIMYFGTRTNLEFDEGIQQKIEAAFDQAEQNSNKTSISKTFEKVLQTDEAFHAIHRRFQTYLLGLTSGPGNPVPIAIDYHSAGRPMMFYAIMLPSFLMPFFILDFVLIWGYVESTYGSPVHIWVSAMRVQNPIRFYIGLFAFSVPLFALAFYYVISIKKWVFGFVAQTNEKVLSTAPPDSIEEMLRAFLTTRLKQNYEPLYTIILDSLLILLYPPLVIGWIIGDNILFIIPLMIISAILMFRFSFKSKQPQFGFDASGNIMVEHNFAKTQQFHLDQVDEVWVRYQSNQNGYIRVSSETAMMRDLVGRAFLKLMDTPELIPSSIVFFLKDETTSEIPLRFLVDASNQDSIDSHQIEFLVAFWLKAQGFTLKLLPSEERYAGDWMAAKNMEESKLYQAVFNPAAPDHPSRMN